ncbi:hypothetical protein ILUMI_22391 [Ignelater luminosus]|uniref:Uncharacterized protein n=1 Tax=Ignelater luminosus TaxID=2038154 RepID=A0A8K0CAA2_IGNLU|nr:hypothetical protein ILUMI_22391 [Ignelater luminosus]
MQVYQNKEKCSDELIISRSLLRPLLQLHTKPQLQVVRDNMDRNTTSGMDLEETDSHFSYSSSNSSYQISGQDQESILTGENSYSQSTTDEHIESESEDTSLPQVIAVSGDSIIAVANPALAMSSAIFATEREANKSKN